MKRRSPERILVSVSIDTECDHDPRWRRSDPLAFESIVEGLPNRLQPAFAEVGAVPTYLLTVEVMEDDASVCALAALQGQHELGTHLHAAFVEPGKKFDDYAGVDSPDFQCRLPPAIEYAKLANLTELFRQQFGYPPKSFRAGRYGAGANTIDSLERLGYDVDTSVVPYTLWQETPPAGRIARLRDKAMGLVGTPAGAVDYRDAPEQPYFPSAGTIASAGPQCPGRLLEVPVSVRPARLLARHRPPSWFRPWFASVDTMKGVVQHQLDRHADSPVVAINMMFHSMEIIEQASPYPQTAADVHRFIDDMQQALAWLGEEGAEFVPLKAMRPAFAATQDSESAGRVAGPAADQASRAGRS